MEKQIYCDAVLFDLDGVLIDSTSCIVRHWTHWAKQHKLNPDDIMQVAHGVRTIETIRMIAPHLDAEQEAEAFTAREVADTDGVLVIEGARRILESLPQDAWGIVTSGSFELATARLKRAGLPIPDVLVTADQVTEGKPSPEPYVLGAKRFGLPSERCVVIEDAPAGVESGRKAGMRVIGISATHTPEELLEKGVSLITSRLRDLKFIKEEHSTESRLTVRVH